MTDCEHESVTSERAYDERPEGSNPLGIIGTCDECGCAMTLDGDEDEDGHPTWEAAWTPEEILIVAHQSGLV